MTRQTTKGRTNCHLCRQLAQTSVHARYQAQTAPNCLHSPWLSPGTLRRQMQRRHVTLAALAAALDVTKACVRWWRAVGTCGMDAYDVRRVLSALSHT